MNPQALLRHIIYPIRIPTPFAVGDVYGYFINDEKKVLVDCGHKADESFELIKNQMNELDLDISDLDEIWLTHGHPDHFGQAARLAEASGAGVFGHAKERSNFAGNDDGALFDTFFRDHHIPEKHITQMVDQLDWLQQFQMPVVPEWIEEGDEVSSGKLTFRVRHTPGHAPGHLILFGDDGLIFGGDVLLEHVSTNALINFDPDTKVRNKSLLQYRKSLRWMRDQDGLVLPGHGEFITNIREVADHHLSDHRRRYQEIKQLLSRKPYSLYELALTTFPDATKKGAVFLVLSEVLGYLDWGIEEGAIQKVEGIFSLTE